MKKYRKIVSAGCSLIFGSELGDEQPFSKQTYPALLSKHFDIEYDCIAYPSASNQGIAKQILEYQDKENVLFIIQWTYPSRLGFNLSYKYNNKHNESVEWFDMAPNNWDLDLKFSMYADYTKQLHDMEIDQLSNTLYKHCGNQNTFDFYSYMAVISTHSIIQTHSGDYVSIAGCSDLVNKFDLTDFEGNGFVEWCKIKNFKHGKYHHPLHDAHQSAYEYILKNVNIFDD